VSLQCADRVSRTDGAEAAVAVALGTWGRLDVVVSKAGIVRDSTLVNMTDSEFDDVMAVHVRSTFLVSRTAARHWRALAKSGEPGGDWRIINTTSSSGLYGNVGQSNYGAARAAIAAFTIITVVWRRVF
jgi:NAD(P)-dependent dehydrogenase (short-subunit alcohol dehydrogenase family)